jgi:hypothetical protein
VTGDKNTRFFHLRASQRRRDNKIVILKKQNGQLTENEAEMSSMTTNFYKHLYTSEGTVNMKEVLIHVHVKVTPEMNRKSIAPFNETKVKDALFQMFPIKAPGPDGFPAHFF